LKPGSKTRPVAKWELLRWACFENDHSCAYSFAYEVFNFYLRAARPSPWAATGLLQTISTGKRITTLSSKTLHAL